MSGPRSISKSSLMSAADRLRRLAPPSFRAFWQFEQEQNASGKALAAEVPRKVIFTIDPPYEENGRQRCRPQGVVRPEGFEPPTPWFEATCSIH